MNLPDSGYHLDSGFKIRPVPDIGYRISISESDCVKNRNFLIHCSLVITWNLGSFMLLKWKASGKTGEGIYILQSIRAVPDHEFNGFRISDIIRIVDSRSGRYRISDTGFQYPNLIV